MTSSRGALAGIRVLDFGRVLAAPLAAQILGDLGAEVIKVERPGIGDEARVYGPGFISDAAGGKTRESGFYVAANRNKRSILIDLSTPSGRDVARRLALTSDVLIENFLPGTMKRFGLDYASLRTDNPRLVYCSVTGYGQTGPYSDRPGYDAVFQAQSGFMAVTGIPDGEPGGGPMRSGPSIMDATAGTNAAVAIMAALLERERLSGKGQHIDIALLDSAVAIQSHAVQNYLLTGVQPERSATAGNGGHPARVFATRNGDIYISAGNQKMYERLCILLDRPDLIDDPRFIDNPARFRNRRLWDAIIEPVIAKRDRHELLDRAVAAGIPATLVNTYPDLFSDEHSLHRGLIYQANHPLAEEAVTMISSPFRLERTPPTHRFHPPLQGEHTREVLASLLDMSDAELINFEQENRAAG